MKKALILVIGLFWVLAGQLSWAGPLVFGPQKFIHNNGKPEKEVVMFEVANPTGTFWLQVSIGEAVPKTGGTPKVKERDDDREKDDVREEEKERRRSGDIQMINLVESGRIWLNGKLVARLRDFDVERTKQFGFQKDITLDPFDTLEVELQGKPGSFITVQIREAEPNVTVINSKGDLTGLNMGDQVLLSWAIDDRASEYVVSRSISIDGPWAELFRLDDRATRTGGGKVDRTPDARLMDLCYKVDALDTRGRVIRRYDPICVPKFVEKQRQSFNFQRSPNNSGIIKTGKIPRNIPEYPIILASLSLLAAAPDPRINKLCFSNPDAEFTDFESMGRDKTKIQEFLESQGSFLQRRIRDVDVNKTEIDPAEEIFNAAKDFQINPQVLLTTLQKEHSTVTTPVRPGVDILRSIMECGRPSTIRGQIRCAAAQMRLDFNRLSGTPPRSTGGDWQVGVPRQSGDPRGSELDADDNSITVTPANKPTAILYSYTPWVGAAFGGGRKIGQTDAIGGNGLFCELWEQFGFKPPEPLVLNPQNPTFSCSSPSLTFTATGGTPPYTWTTSNPNAVITPSADTKTATLTPPANINVGGVAIVQVAHSVWTSACTPFQTDFNCFDCTGVRTNCPPSPDYVVFGSAGFAMGCYTGFCGTCGPGQCRQPDLLCLPTCIRDGCPNTAIPLCSDPRFIGWPSPQGDLSLGFLCDVRTQAQKDASCNPCRLEMQGGTTVTVKDANPNQVPVTATVTVR